MLQTTYQDQLVKLFNQWQPYTRLWSIAAQEKQRNKSTGEVAVLPMKREVMHIFYETRYQLRDCIAGLKKEIEANLLTMVRPQHDITYFNNFIPIYRKITDYLNEDYPKVLARFEGVAFDIEPPKKEVLGEFQNIGGTWHRLVEEPGDPYWNEYLFEEQSVIHDPDSPSPLVPINIIKTIAEDFSTVSKMLYIAVTQSATYKEYPELIPLISDENQKIPTQNQPLQTSAKLQWNGTKTDLAELIWVLVKSGLIIDSSTGRSITIAGLAETFQNVFEIDKLDVDGLVNKRIRNTNKALDEKTFIDHLQKLIHSYKERSIK